jgi:hypothetical protein
MPQGFDVLFPASALGQVGSAAVAPVGWLVRLQCFGEGVPLGPAIRRVWVDFRLNEVQTLTGRKWKLLLHADNLPEAIALNGLPNNQLNNSNMSGTQTCNDLWNLWQSGRAVDFYDVVGNGPFSVKLTGLSQKRAAIGRGLTLEPDWILNVELAEVV